MKTFPRLNGLLDEAESEHRCACGMTDAMRRALRRRALAGELVNPYRNVYARREYWGTLTPVDRMLHVARALAQLHPRWVFAGLTAATAHGLEHAWGLHNGRLSVAVSASYYGKESRQPLDHVYMRTVEAVSASGLQVTTVPRTLVDCGLRYPFEYALALFDSALRNRCVTRDDVLAVCDGLVVDCGVVLRLLRYADARSENGGESLVRGIVITHGFVVPELQVSLVDPANPNVVYRVDFLWRLHDGRQIALEYDGMAKYADAEMTGGRTVRQTVHAEREREAALRRAGITTILRVDYDEVTRVQPVVDKLLKASVPTVDGRWGRVAALR